MTSKMIAPLALAAVAAFGLALGSAEAGGNKDLVDTATGAGQFKTLTAALNAAGLADTLKGGGPFTVFAPTDAAFAKLPEGTVDQLLKPENRDRLTAILTFHVVPGRIMAADIGSGAQPKTVQGGALSIKAQGGAVMVNEARVTAADISASNGVIHVIDTVILPPRS